MIGRDYIAYIKELFIQGLGKEDAKRKYLNKWKRENIDSIWKEEKLAKKTFEVEWEELEKWDEKRVIQEQRKKVLAELGKQEAKLG